MKELKIKFLSDVRKVFKKDESIELEFNNDVILLVGRNGSGKSTLVNSIRSHICSNNDRGNKFTGSMNYDNVALGLLPFTEVTTDFKNIFHLSSEFDDPRSINNSYDATAYIELGGFATQHVSNGQKLFYLLNKFIKKFKDSFNEDTLLIFDEIDTGFDLKNQIDLYNVLPKMCKKYGCSILVITHSAIPFMLDKYRIYNLNERKYDEEYLNKLIKSK